MSLGGVAWVIATLYLLIGVIGLGFVVVWLLDKFLPK